MCLWFNKKHKFSRIDKELQVNFLDNQYILIDKELHKLYTNKMLLVMSASNQYSEYLIEPPVFSVLVERISEYMVSELLNAYMKNKMNGLLRISLLWYVVMIMDGVKEDIYFIPMDTSNKIGLRMKIDGELYEVCIDVE